MLSIIDSATGLPMVCDTCGAPATGVWYGWDGTKPQRVCSVHNPMSLPGTLPVNFTYHDLCPTCRQPVRLS